MYLVTGGTGFIGSNIANALSSSGQKVVICDYLISGIQMNNVSSSKISDFITIKDLPKFLKNNENIEFIIHMGANSSTIERAGNLIWKQNVLSTLNLWNYCTLKKIKFLYASSASTYGNGTKGFRDNDNLQDLYSLQPLNLYGWTKYISDYRMAVMALNKLSPPQWIGLKFFNVFGPNEYHKGDMRSVILKAFEEYKEKGSITLFKSHNKNYNDGEQMRDFIYINDCIKVILWLINKDKLSGIFNCGTGKAKSFLDLSNAIFSSLNKKPNVNFIDTPKEIRKNYQYFTQADMTKLLYSGYKSEFYSLESGIKDYIQKYLSPMKIYK